MLVFFPNAKEKYNTKKGTETKRPEVPKNKFKIVNAEAKQFYSFWGKKVEIRSPKLKCKPNSQESCI